MARGSTFECLTLEAVAEFNRNTLDVNGIRYFSRGAECHPELFDTFRYPHSIIRDHEPAMV